MTGQDNKSGNAAWLLWACLAALMLVFGWWWIALHRPSAKPAPPRQASGAVEELKQVLIAKLGQAGIPSTLLRVSQSAEGIPQVHLIIPRFRSAKTLLVELEQFGQQEQASPSIQKKPGNPGEDVFQCLFFLQGREALELEAIQSHRPQLAILLDDWGYSLKPLEALQKLPGAISLAVFPQQLYSRKIAEQAWVEGHEILVHLPMEPYGTLPLVSGTLLSSMNDHELMALTSRHIDSVPHAVGVNNHEGSKGTEDPRIMRVVLEQLRQRGVFFLDSLTSPRSVAAKLAAQMGLHWASRQVFLDDEDYPDAIEEAARKAAHLALSHGSCIAIGHPRENTLQVLASLIPEFQRQGIELVPVSTLVH